jgi:hypothetical protein
VMVEHALVRLASFMTLHWVGVIRHPVAIALRPARIVWIPKPTSHFGGTLVAEGIGSVEPPAAMRHSV